MPPKRKPQQEKTATPLKKARISAASNTGRRGSVSIPTRVVRPRKTVEGVVLTCGQGEVGQLGLGEDVTEKSRFTLVPGLDKVVDISAGGMHTVCLTSDGTVYTFGCDDEGALGRQASDEESFTPGRVQLEKPAVQISAGDSHSAALLEDGRVFAWGCFRDSHGPMGLQGSGKEPSKTPVLIKLTEAVEKIASGADHLLLMTVTGQLFTCGCPEQGQLGRVTARSASRETVRQGMSAFLVPQAVPSRRKLVYSDIWASTYGTIAKDKSNDVYCFGLNNYHQLTAASTVNTEGPIFAPVQNGALHIKDRDWIKCSGGEHHTLLLDNTGKVHCLGRKEYGRLGLGEGCGDAENVTAIPALEQHKCVDIGCGSAVSFAVTDKGDLYGWGMGSSSQLSSGNDEEDVWTPRVLKSKALEGKKVLAVDAGGQHSVVLAVSLQAENISDA